MRKGGGENYLIQKLLTQGIFWPLPGPKCINKMSIVDCHLHLMMAAPKSIETQGLCSETFGVDPELLVYTPDCLKTREICDKAVAHNP